MVPEAPLNEDFSAIERSLLHRMDAAQGGAPPPLAAGGAAPSHAPADISAILEAVQLTATSMNDLAERARELEAHTEAFAASNEELEASNRQLTIELGEIVQQRDDLAASLQAEAERLKRLESVAAEHIARASSLERDVASTQADLAKIAEVVGGHLAGEAAPAARTETTAAS